MELEKYIVSIPTSFLGTEFDCATRSAAINFFSSEITKHTPQRATVYKGRKDPECIVAFFDQNQGIQFPSIRGTR